MNNNKIPAHQKTITALDKNNLKQWLIALRSEAETLQIAPHIENIKYVFEPLRHISVIAITSVLLASNPADLATETITPGTPLNPCLIIHRVQKNY